MFHQTYFQAHIGAPLERLRSWGSVDIEGMVRATAEGTHGTNILSVTYAIALAASAARAESNKPSEGAEGHTRATDGDLERHAMRESTGALWTAAMVGFVRE